MINDEEIMRMLEWYSDEAGKDWKGIELGIQGTTTAHSNSAL